jgi:single-strand DNA-binding protein
MVNHITSAGHLGAAPAVRFTSSGKKVTTLRIATHVRRANADDTIWWRVSLWGEQYDKMISFLKKGSAVIVFGDLQKPEIFTDRDGKPQISMNITATHIQFSPFGKGERAQQDGQASQGQGPQAYAHQEAGMSAAAPAPAYQGGGSSGYNPYTPPAAGKPPAPSGGTYDDEIPF